MRSSGRASDRFFFLPFLPFPLCSFFARGLLFAESSAFFNSQLSKVCRVVVIAAVYLHRARARRALMFILRV